jgi:hypothetical protein
MDLLANYHYQHQLPNQTIDLNLAVIEVACCLIAGISWIFALRQDHSVIVKVVNLIGYGRMNNEPIHDRFYIIPHDELNVHKNITTNDEYQGFAFLRIDGAIKLYHCRGSGTLSEYTFASRYPGVAFDSFAWSRDSKWIVAYSKSTDEIEIFEVNSINVNQSLRLDDSAIKTRFAEQTGKHEVSVAIDPTNNIISLTNGAGITFFYPFDKKNEAAKTLINNLIHSVVKDQQITAISWGVNGDTFAIATCKEIEENLTTNIEIWKINNDGTFGVEPTAVKNYTGFVREIQWNQDFTLLMYRTFDKSFSIMTGTKNNHQNFVWHHATGEIVAQSQLIGVRLPFTWANPKFAITAKRGENTIFLKKIEIPEVDAERQNMN